MLYRRFARFAWALILTASGALPGVAAEGGSPVLAPGDFGLVEGLRWGMSSAEAKRALPALEIAGEIGFVDPRLAKVGTDKVAFQGCSLAFTLKFFRDRLDQVRVNSTDANSCHDAIEDALLVRYADPKKPLPCPNLIHREWRVSGTAAAYTYACAEYRTNIRRFPPGVTIEFTDLDDLSGRVAQQRANLNSSCQLIAVDLQPAADADGASDPVLSPDLGDLGCARDNYPAVSIRLQEGGVATLSVRVRADGGVTDAQLLTSSGKPRIDTAALSLARRTLKFVPAMRNAIPVEVSREVTVTFRIINPMRGGAEVFFPCSDGKALFATPCYGPMPATSALSPRNGRRLTLTSTDVRAGADLPDDFTVYGANKSPALSWTAGPPGTRSYAIIAEDPGRSGATDPTVYWIIYNIPVSARGLPQGVPGDMRVANPAGAINYVNVHGPGYRAYGALQGVTRTVHFQVFALNVTLAPDFATSDRLAVFNAMTGHVLASGEFVVNVTGRSAPN